MLLSGVEFPSDANIIDVTTVIEDGIDLADNSNDDTAAIQAALDSFAGGGGGGGTILYFPDGTYNISATLLPSIDDGLVKRTIFQGQSRTGTIFKLADNDPDFNDALNPAAVINFKNGTNPAAQSFRNAVRDLTIDVGTDNDGAIGINFVGNNNASIRNVEIKSSDAQGDGYAGINTNFSENGPFLVENTKIDGFDYSVIVGPTNINSQVFSDITVDNFDIAGFKQFQNSSQGVSIFDLSSTGGAGAVVDFAVDDPDPAVSIVNANVTAGTGATVAFDLGAIAYLRGVTTSGYTTGLEHFWDSSSTTVSGDLTDFEFAGKGDTGNPDSGYRYAFGDEDLSGLGLSLEMAPDIAWGNINTDWVNPFPSGEGAPVPTGDQTAVIQAAIDTAGTKTVYLPRGSYQIDGTLVIRGDVERIIGTEARLTGDGSIVFASGTASNVIIERIEGLPELIHDSSRNLILASVGFSDYRNTENGTGKLYVESATGSQMLINGQTVIAHQLNLEAAGGDNMGLGAYVINNGGSLVINGFKTEAPGNGTGFTFIKTINRGQTEVLGGLNYYNSGVWDAGAAAYEVGDDSALGLTIKGFDPGGGNSPEFTVKQTRDGVTRTEVGGERSYFIGRDNPLLSASTTAPSVNVLISNDDTGGDVISGNNGTRTQWRSTTKHGNPGQIFETGNTAIRVDAITLQLESNGLASEHEDLNWFMDILELDGSNNIVANVSSTVDLGIAAGANEYLTFDIDDTELEANTRYAFRWGILGGVVDPGITDFQQDNDGTYAFNMVATSPGAVTSQGTTTAFTSEIVNRSFDFYIQGEELSFLTANATAPSTNILLSNDDTGADGISTDNGARTQWRGTVKHGDPGQIFETGDNAARLEAVTLQLESGGLASQHENIDWFMDVLELDGSNNIVANLSSTTGSGIAAGANEYLTFDITDTDLEANTRYAIRWGVLSQVDPGITDFQQDDDGLYAFNMVATSPGAVTSQGTTTAFNSEKANRSFDFYLQGEEIVGFLSSSGTAPTEGVFISNDDTGADVVSTDNGARTQWRGTANHGDPGQIFETGSKGFLLQEITLQLESGGLASQHENIDWFMDVLELDGSNNIVANLSSTTGSGIAAGANEYLTFDITDTDLEANTRYAIRWGVLSQVDPGITDFQQDDDGLYAFNMVATSPGAVTSQGTTTAFNSEKTNRSFDFYLTGSESPVTGYTPEANAAPTAVALSNQVTSMQEFPDTTTRVKVADVSVTDDANGDNNLWVSGTNNQLFEVDATGLYIRAGAQLVAGTYNVTVNVDDAHVGTAIPDATAFYTLTTSAVQATNAYQFDSNANDTGTDPTPNNGTLTGDAFIDTTDSASGAGSVNLDGAGDYVELNNADYQDEFDKYTVNLFFKPTSLTGTQTLYEEGGSGNGMAIRLNGSTLEARFKDGTSILDLSASGVTLNAWNNVTVTFDNGVAKLYLNGWESDDEASTTSFIVGNHGNPAALGATNGEDAFGATSTGNYFSGLIDLVRIYDGEALNETQIQRIIDLE